MKRKSCLLGHETLVDLDQDLYDIEFSRFKRYKMPKVGKKSGPRTERTSERPIHPYSRKALKLGKKILHNKRVESAKNHQAVRLELLGEKLLWFQEHLDDRNVYSKQDMLDLVSIYRNRFNEELEQISIVENVGNRQARQHASRESAIRITTEDETNQFEGTGIEVPDLINKKHLDEFRQWNGEVKFIQNLKLRKISIRDEKVLEGKSKKGTQELCEQAVSENNET